MRKRVGILLGIVLLSVSSALPAMASSDVPVSELDAIVQKHCAVCHSASRMNGGLSLQHVSVSHVAPSLAAMMLSKLTSGLPLETIQSASSDSAAADLVMKRLNGGAIMAAGIAPRDMSLVKALTLTLAAKATGATAWHVSDHTASRTTASVLREVSRGDFVESYRIIVACDDGRIGTIHLAWAPVPKNGTMSISIDGAAPITYSVEGSETMATGAVTKGLASFRFPLTTLPTRSLNVSGLFPNEQAEFSFADLSDSVRHDISRCFSR